MGFILNEFRFFNFKNLFFNFEETRPTSDEKFIFHMESAREIGV